MTCVFMYTYMCVYALWHVCLYIHTAFGFVLWTHQTCAYTHETACLYLGSYNMCVCNVDSYNMSVLYTYTS